MEFYTEKGITTSFFSAIRKDSKVKMLLIRVWYWYDMRFVMATQWYIVRMNGSI